MSYIKRSLHLILDITNEHDNKLIATITCVIYVSYVYHICREKGITSALILNITNEHDNQLNGTITSYVSVYHICNYLIHHIFLLRSSATGSLKTTSSAINRLCKPAVDLTRKLPMT